MRPAIIDDVEWSAYDFLDLGCSSGGSLAYGKHRFGGVRGLGVDLDERKVQEARAAGHEVVQADAAALPSGIRVRFITMLDFLEHLPDLKTVERVLASAARSASDFLYIKHPSFEGYEYAESLGVRQYWWNWSGHTSHVRVADYCGMFERLGLNQYKIRYLGRVDDADHETVVPAGTPKNTGADAARRLAVPSFRFAQPLWRRQDIFIALRAFEPEEWAAITRPTERDRELL